jgi:uncharacterized PurR-regulated membrane protein YhhQ (DUF165 family)
MKYYLGSHTTEPIVVVLCHAGLVAAANGLVHVVGALPVAPGVIAPAGTLIIGLSFALRDVIHSRYGLIYALTSLPIGCIVSAVFSPGLAVASGVTFLVSETLDMLIWSRVRRTNEELAVLISGLVVAPIDSMLFCWLAFGSVSLAGGATVGKMWATLAAYLALRFLASRR